MAAMAMLQMISIIVIRYRIHHSKFFTHFSLFKVYMLILLLMVDLNLIGRCVFNEGIRD